ncbi:MAG: hypothetical protein HOP10_15595 [Chitinophagaceae bacterium]|nr:hypothetical protein [Chitinophagaceae bacterium]
MKGIKTIGGFIQYEEGYSMSITCKEVGCIYNRSFNSSGKIEAGAKDRNMFCCFSQFEIIWELNIPRPDESTDRF